MRQGVYGTQYGAGCLWNTVCGRVSMNTVWWRVSRYSKVHVWNTVWGRVSMAMEYSMGKGVYGIQYVAGCLGIQYGQGVYEYSMVQGV